MTQVAFVFPGQGSQKLGMLAEPHATSDLIQHYFNQANSVLGYDLWQVVQHDEVKLNQTQFTQPAILTASVALWHWAQHQGLDGARVAYMAGHSLGEYSALVCAQSIAFEDAVQLVSTRGELMQASVESSEGAMAVILGMEDDLVNKVCGEVAQDEVVTPVNFNCPGQVVIAGQRQAVERAINYAKEQGARRAQMLPVSVPSHCALMQPAADAFAKVLEGIRVEIPKVPVLQNATLDVHTNPDDIKQALVDQLCAPVKWTQTIEHLSAEGMRLIVECGPGKVLTGLNKRIASNVTLANIYDQPSLEASLQCMQEN